MTWRASSFQTRRDAGSGNQESYVADNREQLHNSEFLFFSRFFSLYFLIALALVFNSLILLYAVLYFTVILVRILKK